MKRGDVMVLRETKLKGKGEERFGGNFKDVEQKVGERECTQDRV